MALNTNATFTHFMVRAGTFEMNAPGKSKVAADAFETLVAAYYFENGFTALCTWVASILQPLIAVAQKAYTELYDIIGLCIFVIANWNIHSNDDKARRQKRIRRVDSSEHFRGKMARTSSLPRLSFSPSMSSQHL